MNTMKALRDERKAVSKRLRACKAEYAPHGTPGRN
jgi:hypothetical protein